MSRDGHREYDAWLNRVDEKLQDLCDGNLTVDDVKKYDFEKAWYDKLDTETAAIKALEAEGWLVSEAEYPNQDDEEDFLDPLDFTADL